MKLFFFLFFFLMGQILQLCFLCLHILLIPVNLFIINSNFFWSFIHFITLKFKHTLKFSNLILLSKISSYKYWWIQHLSRTVRNNFISLFLACFLFPAIYIFFKKNLSFSVESTGLSWRNVHSSLLCLREEWRTGC